MNRSADDRNKDMYLPKWVLSIGIFLLVPAAICFALIFLHSVRWVIGLVILLPPGLWAVLSWRNQWAEMESSASFIYSTALGRKRQYYFSEILRVKQNLDSMTLILENGRLHIENCAILSPRFTEAVNRALSHNGYPD